MFFPQTTEININVALLRNARVGSMSARTQCPSCDSGHVVPLDGILFSPNLDFFRCDDCKLFWQVPKAEDGPASSMLSGAPITSRVVEMTA
jgi:transposase-like protein